MKGTKGNFISFILKAYILSLIFAHVGFSQDELKPPLRRVIPPQEGIVTVNGVEAAERRLLVGFKKDTVRAQRDSAHAAVGAKVKHRYKFIDVELVELPKEMSLETGIDRYKKDSSVRYAEPDYIIRLEEEAFEPVEAPAGRRAALSGAAVLPDDPRFDEQWALHNTGQTGGTEDADIDAPEAWEITTGSGSVVVAVIDTGVDYTHQDLAASMWVNQAEKNGSPGVDDDGNGYVDDIYGYDFCNNDCDPKDDHYHGTHCAGIIAAVQGNGLGISGVAPGVRIMALKFLSGAGYGYTSNAVKCFEYVTAMGADLTSNSWGGGGYDQALADAIAHFAKPTICAAGNCGCNSDLGPMYPAAFENENIISVLATDHNDTKAWWSNYGLESVDIGAPGVDILSTILGNAYAMKSGTSMAAPHVAGAAALVLSHYPSLNTSQVCARITWLGEEVTALTDLCLSGRRLNLKQSLGSLNYPPEAREVSITGTLEVGETLTGVYTYYDDEGDPEGASAFKWYRADDAAGKNTVLIAGAESTSYTLQLDDGGRYIRFKVKPAASIGNSPGTNTMSEWFGPICSAWPIIRTNGFFSLSSDYVGVSGSVVLLNGTAILERGFVYSTTPNPTVTANKVACGSDEGPFSKVLTELVPYTTYYVRAYAINSAGTAYGREISCKTLPSGNHSVKLMPDDDGDSYSFGGNVDISGNYAVVNAKEDSVFVFERDTSGRWSKVARLPVPETAKGCAFGKDIAISGDYLIAGAHAENYDKGAAYIFERNPTGNWIEKARLTASDGVYHAYFGWSVSISGDYALVGSYSRGYHGAAYVFKRTTSGEWVEKQILIPGYIGTWDFGYDVNISGSLAIINAAPTERETFTSFFDSAYIFRLGSSGRWIEEVRLTASEYNATDNFGASVAICDNYAFVGAPSDDEVGENTGAAYMFKRSNTGTWSEVDIFTPLAPTISSYYFGGAVAINNNVALVGTSYNNALFIYIKIPVYENWLLVNRLYGTLIYNYFGTAVAADDNYFIVGARGDMVIDKNVGAAYVYDLSKTNFPPAAAMVFTDGVPVNGECLTGNYTYYDREGDAEGPSLFRWFRADNDQGTNASYISGATTKTYSLQSADIGKYICFQVIPIAAYGELTGLPARSSWIGPVSPVGSKVLSVGSSTGNPGYNVTLDIRLNDGTGINAFGLDLTFDPALLEYQASAVGGGLLPAGFSFNAELVGDNIVRISGSGTAGQNLITGSGTLASVTFKIKEDVQIGTATNLLLTNLSGDIQDIIVINGKIQVIDCPDNYDVNQDGSVTPGDALMAFQHYLGLIEIVDPCSLLCADANNDGSITPGDALLIFRSYLGLN